MSKIGKINIWVIGLYLIVFLYFIISNLLVSGIKIIPLIVFAYYSLTGFVFGFIEVFIILKCYIDSKKKILLVWFVLALIYISGSVYWAFFSDFVL